MKSFIMKSISFTFLIIGGLILFSCSSGEKDLVHESPEYPAEFTLLKTDLLNKIKGGWAGQVIGCTYGGPTEFQYNGTMIQDYVPIPWNDSLMEFWYTNIPGLYDDIYIF
jgi:hypothetical protein